MLNDTERGLVENLIRETGCGLHLALKALSYIKEYRGEKITMIGYVKAKSLAVATPNLTFLERVKKFSN